MSELVVSHKNIIDKDTRKLNSSRYHRVTKSINANFWDTDSDSKNSLYVGSYGRNTAISTSDIDILVSLPRSKYDQFNLHKGNVQSQLLQAVKTAIEVPYPHSDIRADGQVIKINFFDNIKFEILPAFRKVDFWGNPIEGYDYPDTNMGGNWEATNPKAEQDAMRDKNNSTNGLYRDTCRHIRYIRDTYFSSCHLAGIVIDSFTYDAIGNWKYVASGESTANKGDYEKGLLNYFIQNNMFGRLKLSSPGSDQLVDTKNSTDCLEKVLKKIAI
ncbi:nucleotidyltransferase [Lacticaseibacillus casei]|uniref:SMODS domain-containing nucleotidyltransferase n=1 Tax=Lacticaseibacillus casei TaxID=1582 RepID=UPI001107E7E2|nr:nucleotidyltransferase domain-containing protein [Lacticaseibacillus casei]TLQ51920.1 nucleotidyltransferase [Lacticaseibacillus casei]